MHVHDSFSFCPFSFCGPRRFAEPNKGNGGSTDKYQWTQTLQDVQVTVPLPPGSTAKSVVCKIMEKKITLGLKQKPAEEILSGEFFAPVVADESLWQFDSDECAVQLYLEKVNKMEWWSCVLKGEYRYHHDSASAKMNLRRKGRGVAEMEELVCLVASRGCCCCFFLRLDRRCRSGYEQSRAGELQAERSRRGDAVNGRKNDVRPEAETDGPAHERRVQDVRKVQSRTSRARL